MKKALRKGGLYSLSKKCLLPAKRAFEIRFLPQLCRGKKHFYPSKCAGWWQSRQDVRAAGMFGRKVTLMTFSTVSNLPRASGSGEVICYVKSQGRCRFHTGGTGDLGGRVIWRNSGRFRDREGDDGAGCSIFSGEQELPVVLPGDVADYLQT